MTRPDSKGGPPDPREDRPPTPPPAVTSVPQGADNLRCPRCGEDTAATDDHALARCTDLADAAEREQVPVTATGDDCTECGRPLVYFGADLHPTCAGCRNLPNACSCTVLRGEAGS